MKLAMILFVFLWLGNAEAAPVVSNEAILEKLDSIEKKEDAIVKQLEEIKTELNVVKIRASLKA